MVIYQWSDILDSSRTESEHIGYISDCLNRIFCFTNAEKSQYLSKMSLNVLGVCVYPILDIIYYFLVLGMLKQFRIGVSLSGKCSRCHRQLEYILRVRKSLSRSVTPVIVTSRVQTGIAASQQVFVTYSSKFRLAYQSIKAT